jgi:regulator of PEP synthase PpsR (kinase-PPPase family)
MNKIYNIYQVSDSTGETLDRIFLAIKAQFYNFECKTIHYSFTRTENQINKIIQKSKKEENIIILYTIVDNNLAKYLTTECNKKKIPNFEVLGSLISDFSKLLGKNANRKPSGQHVLDDEYYKRIDAIQFTMTHDDGKIISDLENSDIVLVGVSRTSKTPTSIYLANRGYKTTNIPLIRNKKMPNALIKKTKKTCVVGLICDPSRLSDVRRNRIQAIQEDRPSDYTDEKKIIDEIEESKALFKKYNWPTIDVTRKSVEETAASVIKIFDILNSDE